MSIKKRIAKNVNEGLEKIISSQCCKEFDDCSLIKKAVILAVVPGSTVYVPFFIIAKTAKYFIDWYSGLGNGDYNL